MISDPDRYSNILSLLEPGSGQVRIDVVVSLRINALRQPYDEPGILVAVESGENHAIHACSGGVDLPITGRKKSNKDHSKEVALYATSGVKHDHHVVIAVHDVVKVPRRQFDLDVQQSR